MKKLLILLLFASALFAQIAKFSLVVGDVEIHRGSMVLKAKTSDEIQNKDIIQTKNGKAQIIFSDSTIVTLGKNTDLNIKDYIKSSKENKADLFVGKGVFKVITGEIGKIAPKRFKLKTKTSTIGIRGTVFIGEIDSDLEKIACLDGAITAKIGSKTYEIPKGQMIDHDILANKVVQENIKADDFEQIQEQMPTPKQETTIIDTQKEVLQQKGLKPLESINEQDMQGTYWYGTLNSGYIKGKKLDPKKSFVVYDLYRAGNWHLGDVKVLACYVSGECDTFIIAKISKTDRTNLATNDRFTENTDPSSKLKEMGLKFTTDGTATFIQTNMKMQEATGAINNSDWLMLENPHFAFETAPKEFFKPLSTVDSNALDIDEVSYTGVFRGMKQNPSAANYSFFEAPATVKFEEGTPHNLISIRLDNNDFEINGEGTSKVRYGNAYSESVDSAHVKFFGENGEYINVSVKRVNVPTGYAKYQGMINAKKD